MFIRQVKKKNAKSGKTFFQYQLCQASRIEGKVKQQSILYLGSAVLLEDSENRKSLLKVLRAMIFGQSLLFPNDYSAEIVALAKGFYEKFQIKYKDVDIEKSVSIPPVESKAQMETVDMDSLEIEDSRTFGGEHLSAQIMDKLDFRTCLEGLGFDQKQVNMAHISIISRALFTASEHKTAGPRRLNILVIVANCKGCLAIRKNRSPITVFTKQQINYTKTESLLISFFTKE